jgi:catalase
MSYQKQTLTAQNGAPVSDDQNSLSAGKRGPLLLQDWHLIEKLAHFNRERIPERIVHAKGTGVYGKFTLTCDLSRYTIADHFNDVGKQTETFVRFSTVGGEMGSADAERDPRGFGLRFYTKRGNHDIVGNNTPTFFLRDGIKFPDFIHTQKRNPQTNLKDPHAMWDFWALNPESIHQVTILMSDRGIPANYRQMHGYGSHTFSFWNAQGERFWVKFHFKTKQGIANLTAEQADILKGIDPDSSQRDMVVAIQDGNFPKWAVKVQIMPEAEANTYKINPFDLTKVWSHADYPLIEIGELELNRMPENYFAEVEQVALAPSNLVPGIGVSPDKMLQARLFAYADAQRYRIGANYNQLPVNCPHATTANHHQRGGAMAGTQCPFSGSQTGGDASSNYGPNSNNGLQEQAEFVEPPLGLDGEADRYSRYNQDDFSQAGDLYCLLPEDEKLRLISNIVSTLKVVSTSTQQKMVEHFSAANSEYGLRVRHALGK